MLLKNKHFLQSNAGLWSFHFANMVLDGISRLCRITPCMGHFRISKFNMICKKFIILLCYCSILIQLLYFFQVETRHILASPFYFFICFFKYIWLFKIKNYRLSLFQ